MDSGKTNILFRCTNDQKEYIRNRAEKRNMSMSKYLRYISMEVDVVTIDDLKDLKSDINLQIKYIGNNINQIAHRYNEALLCEESEELINYKKELFKKLEEIDKKIEVMINGHY